MLTQRTISLIRCTPHRTSLAIPCLLYIPTQWNALRESHWMFLAASDLQCLKAFLKRSDVTLWCVYLVPKWILLNMFAQGAVE